MEEMAILPRMKSVELAAAEIGVTGRTLRRWIENYYKRSKDGRAKPGACECRAKVIEDKIFPTGHLYQVPEDEIERLKSMEQTGAGRPRGSRKSA
jgi:transposase-like protein